MVRAVVPGETGPTGGPAFTDTLGVLEAWVDGVLTLRTADDALVEIPSARVVSGKPVPPRPSRFSRLSVNEVERRCMSYSRSVEVEQLGDWELRYLGGTNPFPNAVLAIGDPGVPLDDALEATATFYARHGRQPAIRLLAGSDLERQLRERGWSQLDGDHEVHLAGIAALARRLAPRNISSVIHEDAVTRGWLAGNDRAQENFAAVALSLDLAEVTFGSISADGAQVARARVNVEDGWAFLADLTVASTHRRRGLAHVMTAAMTHWAAERGASVMALQVRANNNPAQAFYAGLGFERHHTYRYLTPSES